MWVFLRAEREWVGVRYNWRSGGRREKKGKRQRFRLHLQLGAYDIGAELYIYYINIWAI